MKSELIEKLKYIGLTNGESRVYLAINFLNKANANTLVKESGVSSSRIHEILKRLLAKGFIGELIENNKKIYLDLGSDKLNQYIESQEKLIQKRKKIVENIIPLLNVSKNVNHNEGITEILEGVGGYKTILNKITSILKKDDTLNVIFGINSEENYLDAISKEWNQKRIKKGIHINILYPKEFKKINKKYSQNHLIKVRYIDKKLISPTIIGIGDGFVGYIVFNPKFKVVAFYGDILSENYKEHFKNLWNLASS